MRVIEGVRSAGIFPFESTPVMRSRKSEKHNNDNAKPSVKIWSLPEELHLRLLEGLPLIDLITMRAVHPVFKDLIDSNPKLWSIANVNGHWPSMGNIRHFERAANRGNVEALIKLGIAYLYDTWDNLGEATTCRSLDQKWHFHETGIRAAEAFRLAESLTPHTAPFTALFLRPPWSANGNYTKTLAFKHLKKMADLNQENSGKILTCVATILGMMEETSSQEEALTYEERAARLSSPWSAFKLWQKKYCTNPQDRGTELEGIRRLRDLGPGACVDARLALCHAYMKKQYGGIPEEQAIGYVHGFVQESHPTWAGMALRSNPQLTNIMRYILIDWLVEVIRMKVFSQRVLHLTVRLVDLFLHRSTCSRSNLQLVGISALVLVSRFQSKEILTVREAAWLTDNTYKYEDVVHMMGEIAATVHGAIYGATTLDFLELFHSFATLEAKTIHLSRYICDLTLLESDVGRYSHAYLAASSVLLSLVMLNGNVTTWLSQMTLHTGLSTRDISLCALHVHKKCLMGRPVIDYRDVTLRSVQEKYSDPEHLSVSCLQPTTSDELCQVLGLDYTLYFIIGCGRPNKRRSSNGDGIAMITSPRGKTCTSRLEADALRQDSATPLLEASTYDFDSYDPNNTLSSAGDHSEHDESEDEEEEQSSKHDEIENVDEGFVSLWSSEAAKQWSDSSSSDSDDCSDTPYMRLKQPSPVPSSDDNRKSAATWIPQPCDNHITPASIAQSCSSHTTTPRLQVTRSSCNLRDPWWERRACVDSTASQTCAPAKGVTSAAAAGAARTPLLEIHNLSGPRSGKRKSSRTAGNETKTKVVEGRPTDRERAGPARR